MKKIISLAATVAITAYFGLTFAQERFVSEEAQNRKALLEEFTGIHCGYCPNGHEIANTVAAQYPDKMFILNIHAGGYAAPSAGEVDLRTPYGDKLVEESGLKGFPAGQVNRHVFSGSAPAMTMSLGPIQNAVNKALALSSYVNIAAKGKLNWDTRELTVTVQLYYTDNAKKDNFVHIAITQDNIIGTQANYGNFNPDQILPGGKYVHHHAFRDFLTGQWGDTVKTTQKGSFVEKTFTKTLPEVIGNVKLELIDLHFIAFVTESHKEVMNVCKIEMEHENGPEFYVSMRNMKQMLDMTCDSNVRFSFTMENSIAAEPITSIVFNCETPMGTKEFEYTPESPLSSSATYTVETSLPVSKFNEPEHFSVKVVKINGKDYPHNASAEADGIKILTLSPSYAINVNIWQDKYGTDITWNLKNMEDNSILTSGGPYEDLPRPSTVLKTTAATLTNSCYAFTIYDKNKDGINSNYGAGHLSITDSLDRNIMVHDGKYKDSLRYLIRFDANAEPLPGNVANEKESMSCNASIVPNPANNQSVLSFELTAAQNVRVRVMASNGACALDLGSMSLGAGKQNIELPVSKLAEGLYFVQVSGKNLNLIQKLMIIR
ncbi:MAG: Omp28-related outer membrane protein [Bacteroides sp.]|nr:Omp28-related outer membrane protein [Bacteroides sp.]MCM1085805.1 Omp28-related outer membrane protein [Bacteroides sp.]